MKLIAAGLVCALLFTAYSRYIIQIVRHEVAPTLSSWMMWVFATGLNVSSYLVASDQDVLSGTYLIVDAIGCVLIVGAVILWSYQGFVLKPFERYYLMVAVGIGIFWWLSHDAFMTNVLVQGLIALGYAPTVHNIVASKKHSESYVTWLFFLAASSVAIYLASEGGRVLALIYAIRGTVMILLLLALMRMYDMINRTS
ncbi:hypothetical protein HY967_02695 [Candidatus Jorgensenbacteria bacterium]|nr:hypothetical protein [Candidatus Jorgensenbacteria bacterium]